MTKQELDAEFAQLRRDFLALKDDHAGIESRSEVNIPEHEDHRAKLRAHIDALHRHVANIRAVRDGALEEPEAEG
jgi:hypothetical protein